MPGSEAPATEAPVAPAPRPPWAPVGGPAPCWSRGAPIPPSRPHNALTCSPECQAARSSKPPGITTPHQDVEGGAAGQAATVQTVSGSPNANHPDG